MIYRILGLPVVVGVATLALPAAAGGALLAIVREEGRERDRKYSGDKAATKLRSHERERAWRAAQEAQWESLKPSAQFEKSESILVSQQRRFPQCETERS